MTPLSKLYDRFISKLDEDLTNKESLIFALVDVAIAKSYKTCVHSLVYTLDTPIPPETESYDGNFIDDLDSDEIELLALWMLYEWNRREQQRLVKQRELVGTSDFNRLPSKKDQLMSINSAMQTILNDINDLKNEFNTYKY